MSSVRKATSADLPRLCKTANLAFANDPVMRWMYPDDGEYFADGGIIMRPLFRRWLVHETTFSTDDCVSLGAFVPPGRPEVTVEPEGPPPSFSPELLAKFAAIGACMNEHTPAEPHWYLNMLATHPDWQRQGLGASVMAPTLEVCARDGVALYLETETIENVAYYSHLGFEVRSEWDLPLDGPHMWGMIIHPYR
ncbi:MAG TPA: GNAT family N-acetyltransferase [Ilumatobacteraceae bacterium]